MIDFSWADVGNRIRDKRLALGLSQQALAEAAGITQPGLLRIERGETNPMMDTLRAIAKALRATVRELMFGETVVPHPDHHLIARVGRILDSGDRAAIAALEQSVATIELLLHRAGYKVDVSGNRRGARENEVAAVPRADRRNKNSAAKRQRALRK